MGEYRLGLNADQHKRERQRRNDGPNAQSDAPPHLDTSSVTLAKHGVKPNTAATSRQIRWRAAGGTLRVPH